MNGEVVCTTKPEMIVWVHCDKCRHDTPVPQGEYPPGFCMWCGAKFEKIKEAQDD